MNTIDRIKDQRLKLILDQPFFGSLIMELTLEEDTAIPTMCTDGETLKFSPEFTDTLDDMELRTVLAHEVLHCALNHHTRRDHRDPKLWNQATDYAINNHLEKYNADLKLAGRPSAFKLPGGGLINPQFAELSAEEIYRILADQQNQGGGGNDGNQDQPAPGGGAPDQPCTSAPSPGEVADCPHPDDTEAQETKWKVALDQAAKTAKGKGQLPSSMERLIESHLRPKLPWNELLNSFMRDSAKDDFAWHKPNKNHLANDILLPGLDSEAMGEIVIAIDTSASVNECLLAEFMAEVNAVADDIRPASITLIHCDAAVQLVESYERGEEIPARKAVGGGGTDFAPVFDYVDEHLPTPTVLVYLTDLMGSFPQDPGYPVIWVAYETTEDAPFGTTIHTD